MNYIDPIRLAGFGIDVGGSVEAGLGFLGFGAPGRRWIVHERHWPHSVAAASTGLGGGIFFTNAAEVGDLDDYFENFSLNTPFFSAQYVIWSFTVTFGKGAGISGSGYPTNTLAWP